MLGQSAGTQGGQQRIFGRATQIKRHNRGARFAARQNQRSRHERVELACCGLGAIGITPHQQARRRRDFDRCDTGQERIGGNRADRIRAGVRGKKRQ